MGEDYIPYIPQPKPAKTPPVEKKKEDPKVLKTVFSSEYDEILEGLDDEDIAELASKTSISNSSAQHYTYTYMYMHTCVYFC